MSENATQAQPLGLYGKMAKIMGEMEHIPKNGTNSFFGYKFASEGDISDAVRNKLSAYNIALFSSMTKWSQSQFTTAKGKTSNKTICEFEFTLVCADSGTSRTSTWCAEADDEQDKGFNKAATAAMKYWLLKTFMIPTGDDPDADNDKQEKGKGKSDKWPTAALVGELIKRSIEKLEVTANEVSQYTGITNLDDLEAWAKYPDRAAAAKAIKAAHDQHMADLAASKPATPKKPQPYLESDLYKVVLNMVYEGNEHHMKRSIAKMLAEGELNTDMTLEQAVKVIEVHKATKLAEKQAADAKKSEPPATDEPDYAALEAEERRNAQSNLDKEAITIRKVKYIPTQNGAGLPKWEAMAYDINNTSVPVVLWGEDVTFIEKAAGHKMPKTDGEGLDIPVRTKKDGKDRRITHVMALDGSWVEKGKKVQNFEGQSVQITNLKRDSKMGNDGFKYTATATLLLPNGDYGDVVNFTVYPTEMTWIRKHHNVGEAGGSVLINATLTMSNGEIHIKMETPVATESQQMFDDLPGMSQAAKNQLEHA